MCLKIQHGSLLALPTLDSCTKFFLFSDGRSVIFALSVRRFRTIFRSFFFCCVVPLCFPQAVPPANPLTIQHTSLNLFPVLVPPASPPSLTLKSFAPPLDVFTHQEKFTAALKTLKSYLPFPGPACFLRVSDKFSPLEQTKVPFAR